MVERHESLKVLRSEILLSLVALIALRSFKNSLFKQISNHPCFMTGKTDIRVECTLMHHYNAQIETVNPTLVNFCTITQHFRSTFALTNQMQSNVTQQKQNHTDSSQSSPQQQITLLINFQIFSSIKE